MYQIFVVEDELLLRQSLRNMIESMPRPYAFCGEASDGEMALSMMQDLMPDILLTDIRMPFLDGFELIKHVKVMMPWIRIIIISGYGEFESAQKAINLGVDLYLLKPVRSAELMEAIEKIARQIESDKRQSPLPQGYNMDELHSALLQHFMQQLLYGDADTGVLLERAQALGLDMVRPFYQAVLFCFDAEDMRDLHAALLGVLNEMKATLYYFGESDQLTLLFCAADLEALNEEAYRVINIVRHELGGRGVTVTTVVGGAVRRLSAIRGAYAAANDMLKKLRGISAGQVIDANDTAQITAEIVSGSGPFDKAFLERIARAEPNEIPALLDGCLGGPEGGKFNSVLMRYDALIEILKLTVQLIAKSEPDADPKDIAARLSAEYDLFAAAGKSDSFRRLALELLTKAAASRQENLGAPKSSPVIDRALEYVRQQYCDPNISLLSVAKHVGMSSAHFSTVFSQTVGKSFISHLTALRMERAKELLSTTDMLLSAIGMEIGYNEPNYFSHVFRKNEGMTPKEYRALYARNPG